MQSLYATPYLPQSALLNRTPIDNELIGQLQAFLESFDQLINPTQRQLNQIRRNDSILWTNLKTNAQRATGMYLYNRDFLLPYINPSDPPEFQLQRKQYGYKCLDDLQRDMIKLVNESRQTNVPACLQLMKSTLNSLSTIAYLQVPLIGAYTAIAKGNNIGEQDSIFLSSKDTSERFLLPRLRGRATVKVTFERPGPTKIKDTSDSISIDDKAEVTIVVDGINYPYTAGNFIDLCLKKYYDNQPITFEQIDFGSGQVANFTVVGTYIYHLKYYLILICN